ncbi:hypothetical protein V0M98_01495 [Pseudomonas silesiensis]|uniref:hypothetical protein n=1 Tax=Pseudomonas silesiensis TaxID=1853130 RepID=UPI0030CDCF88
MPAKRCKKNAQLGLCDDWSKWQGEFLFENSENHCGSELARDGGLTFNMDVGCQIAIASKLAPTGFGGVWKVGLHQY